MRVSKESTYYEDYSKWDTQRSLGRAPQTEPLLFFLFYQFIFLFLFAFVLSARPVRLLTLSTWRLFIFIFIFFSSICLFVIFILLRPLPFLASPFLDLYPSLFYCLV